MKGLIVSSFGLLAASVVVIVTIKMTVVVDGSSLRVASSPILIDQHDESSSRQLQTFKFIGNDPTGPLGLCEGDCDNDSDCSGDLVCYQRDAGQSIPGCSGMPKGRADFCIQSSSSNGDDNGGGGGGGDDNNGGGGGGESFALKLYWERGYYWQEETIERKWCMKCDGSCRVDQKLVIVNCDNGNPTQMEFIYLGQEAQIKVRGTDLCMEANTRSNSISLKSCSSSHRDQLFVAYRGGFHEPRFEISPHNKLGWCLTQRHHPKNRETVLIETCESARSADTSYWNKY